MNDQAVRAFRAILRDLSVQYAQTLNVRIRWLVDTWTAEPGTGVYVGITRDPRRYTDRSGHLVAPELCAGALRSDIVMPLAGIRTDLDRFEPEEADLLSYHGYWSLHTRLAMFRPDLAVATPAVVCAGVCGDVRVQREGASPCAPGARGEAPPAAVASAASVTCRGALQCRLR